MDTQPEFNIHKTFPWPSERDHDHNLLERLKRNIVTNVTNFYVNADAECGHYSLCIILKWE